MFKFWCSSLCDTKIKLNKYTLHLYGVWWDRASDGGEKEAKGVGASSGSTQKKRKKKRKHIIYNTLIDVSFRRASINIFIRVLPAQHTHIRP